MNKKSVDFLQSYLDFCKELNLDIKDENNFIKFKNKFQEDDKEIVYKGEWKVKKSYFDLFRKHVETFAEELISIYEDDSAESLFMRELLDKTLNRYK